MAGLRGVQGTPEVHPPEPPPAQASAHTTFGSSAPSSDRPSAVVIRHSKGKRPLRGQYRPKGKGSVDLSIPPHAMSDRDIFLQRPELAPYQSALGGVGSRPAPSEVPHTSASCGGRASQFPAQPHPGLGEHAYQVRNSGSAPRHSADQVLSPRVSQSGRPFRPPPSEVASGSGSEDYLYGSEEDDGCLSYVRDLDLDDPVQEDAPVSFSDALLLLKDVRPSLFGQLETEPARPMSATSAAILGSSSSTPVQTAALLESPTVTAAVHEAMATVRGSSAPVSEPLQEFPGGFRCGRFLRPTSLPRGTRPGSRRLISRSAVPDSALPASQHDLLVSPGFHTVSLPDKVAADNEELARRALDACTVLDSFVGGLLTAVKDPDQPGFSVRPDVDARTVRAFADAFDTTLRFTARSLATLHLNQVLARRDALLSSSQVITSPQTRMSLRLAPLSSSSLFDDRVRPVLHRQAEAQRDLAFSFPPSRAPPSQSRKRPAYKPPTGPRQKAPRTSGPQRSFAAPRSSAQRPSRPYANRRQPARRQPPPNPGSASRAHPQ